MSAAIAPRMRQRRGTWFVRFYLDGRRVERTTGCRDRGAAELVARRWEREGAEPGSQTTLGEAFARLAADCRDAGTAKRYRNRGRRLAAFYGTEAPLAAVTPLAAREYIAHRRAQGSTDRAIAMDLRALRTVLFRVLHGGQWRGSPDACTPLDGLALTTRANAVYFVQSGPGGPIKIGWASDLDRRLVTMQTGNPVDLALLGWFQGTRDDERRLHARFASARLTREWFAPGSELLGYIATLAHPSPTDKRGRRG